MNNSVTLTRVNPPGITGLKTLYKYYRNNAKSRNLPFELSVQDFVTLTKQNCTYCGASPNYIITGNPRDYKSEETYLKTAYLYNGIDRVNNFDGYVLTNCAPCCSICNHAKATLTLHDFNKWIERIVTYNTEKAR